MLEDARKKDRNESTGSISAILLPPDQLSTQEKQGAVEIDHNSEFKEIFELAEKEYRRLESTSKEFYLVLANPPSIQLPESDVDRLMQILGSTRKEISGSWSPIIVLSQSHYYRVWGKTAFCG